MSLVVLKSVPEVLLVGLPDKDVAVIRAAVGKPVYVVEGEDALEPHLPGTVEVEFRAEDGNIHTIWVGPEHLEYLKKSNDCDYDIRTRRKLINQQYPEYPGWNLVDPNDVLAQHCIGCGKPVVGDRYAWRQRGPFWFEFAHIECAQDIP